MAVRRPASELSFTGTIPSDVRRGPPRGAKIAGVGVLLVVAALVLSARSELQDRAATSSQPSTTVPDTGPPPASYSTTAPQLAELYAANEVRADQLVLGKWIDLAGVISSVQKDVDDRPQLIFDGEMNGTVVARLAESQAHLAGNIVPGGELSVRCLVKGKVLGTPFLDDCLFVQTVETFRRR